MKNNILAQEEVKNIYNSIFSENDKFNSKIIKVIDDFSEENIKELNKINLNLIENMIKLQEHYEKRTNEIIENEDIKDEEDDYIENQNDALSRIKDAENQDEKNTNNENKDTEDTKKEENKEKEIKDKQNKNSTISVEDNDNKKITSTQKKLFLILGFIIVVIGLTFAITKIKPSEKKEEIQVANQNDAIKLDDIDTKNNTENPENNNEELEINSTQQEELDKLEKENTSQDTKEIDNAINNVENENINEEQPIQKEKKEKIAIAFYRNTENQNTDNKNVKTKDKLETKDNELITDNIKRNKLKKRRAKNEIKQGSVLPAILITAINTDLPGTILGQIRENVYDTVTGETLLIPKGSKLFGRYESQIQAGQNRVLIVWDKLILPNGNYLNLISMQGADNLGNSGLKDKVDRHIFALLGRSILSSVLNIGNNLSKSVSFGIGGKQFGLNGQPSDKNNQGASPFEQATGQILQQGVNRKPTITIRKGFKFNIIVNEDLELIPYKY